MTDYDPDPDRDWERQRDERLCTPGSQNYNDQLQAELTEIDRYWSDNDLSEWMEP